MFGLLGCATHSDPGDQLTPLQYDGWGERVRQVSPTGTEWFIKSAQPDGGDGTDVSIEGCVPDCEDRQCGSNGCGGLCGKCVSDHPCRDSVCSDDHQCVELKRTEPPYCHGVFFFQCKGGELNKVSCVSECKYSGSNRVSGCGVKGASTSSCNCSNDEQACSVSYRQCDGPNEVSGCLADEGVWYTLTCDGFCKQGGHHASIGCTGALGCVCVNKAKDGSLCKPSGQPCGSGAGIGNLQCCGGLVCTVDANKWTCQPPLD